MTMPDQPPVAPGPRAQLPRGRRPKRHPARRARRAVGAASVSGMLLITGGLAVTHAVSTSPATTGTTATTASTGSTASTATTGATTTTVTKAQASTPTTQADTSTSGS